MCTWSSSHGQVWNFHQIHLPRFKHMLEFLPNLLCRLDVVVMWRSQNLAGADWLCKVAHKCFCSVRGSYKPVAGGFMAWGLVCTFSKFLLSHVFFFFLFFLFKIAIWLDLHVLAIWKPYHVSLRIQTAEFSGFGWKFTFEISVYFWDLVRIIFQVTFFFFLFFSSPRYHVLKTNFVQKTHNLHNLVQRRTQLSLLRRNIVTSNSQNFHKLASIVLVYTPRKSRNFICISTLSCTSKVSHMARHLAIHYPPPSPPPGFQVMITKFKRHQRIMTNKLDKFAYFFVTHNSTVICRRVSKNSMW